MWLFTSTASGIGGIAVSSASYVVTFEARDSTETIGPLAMNFELTSMVSLNLAIFNLLPIPILDGGVILLLLVEMFMRRDLSLRVKEAVFKLGFVFLMAVVAFVLYNDISKLAG